VPPSPSVLLDLLFVAVGLFLVAKAADLFVEAAAGLAVGWGVPAVVVGAVIIGFGTSAPELLVSTLAASKGETDVAMGNAVGSNLANVLLVLGAATLLRPALVAPRILRREMPLSFIAVVALALAVQGGITRPEAAVLLVLLVPAMGITLFIAEHPGDEEAGLSHQVEEELAKEMARGPAKEARRALLGLVGTVAGAQLLVEGALGVADGLGVASGPIGLTLVAIGTSLPELATAIQASRRGEADLVIGNVLGSNIFNSLAVAGAAGLVHPGPAGTVTGVPAVAMVGAMVLAWALLWIRGNLRRWEGAIGIGLYVVVAVSAFT
jgi:cation:H+ antiporter